MNYLETMELYARERRVPIIGAGGRKILENVVAEKNPRRVLEIGAAIGYSALLIAARAPEAEIVSIELDEARARTAREFIAASPFKDRIRIVEGDAAKVLPQLSETYDLVFIDAAKGQYVNYFHLVLPRLSEGGVIVADNVLFRGYVTGAQRPPRRYKTIVDRLRLYIETVEAHPWFQTTIYEDGDGLAVSYDHRGKSIEKT